MSSSLLLLSNVGQVQCYIPSEVSSTLHAGNSTSDTMLYVVGQDACVWFGAYTGTTLLTRRDTAYHAEAGYSHMSVSLHNSVFVAIVSKGCK